MSLELTGGAHINRDGEVQIVIVANNPTTETIRLGSKLKEIRAWSESVEQYGETMGHIAAPMHLDIPPEKAKAFTRRYPTEQPDVEAYDDMEWSVDLLTPTVSEEVTVEAKVFVRDDEMSVESLEFQFTPTDLPEKATEAMIERLREYPLTSNDSHLG